MADPLSCKDLAFGDLEREIATTRRVLERLPDSQFAWKVHEKPMPLGRLAMHVANLLQWTLDTLDRDGLDLATPPKMRNDPQNLADVLSTFDQNAAAVRKSMASTDEAALRQTWTLRQGDQVLYCAPRSFVLRVWCINHLVHHRAQLCVYLRLLDLPVPRRSTSIPPTSRTGDSSELTMGKGKRNPKVDAYISRAQPFAQPILTRIRDLFHRACPDVEETFKWGVPFFLYKGTLGGMAGFKKHVGWGLWKAKLIKPPSGAKAPFMNAAKVTDVSQLPSDAAMLAMMKQAVALNEGGTAVMRAPRAKKPPPKVPVDLAAALKKSARAAATFKAFSPSHQREYVEWITDAKQLETQKRRIVQAIEMMTQGKSRNWKYEKRARG